MKYFAMIGEECRGPFTLDQLEDAGVRPSTYIWCKGMTDWQKAEEVADVCRYFRQRIAEIQHPTLVETPSDSSAAEERDQLPPFPSLRNLPHIEEVENVDSPPRSTLIPAILLAIFCCPLPGIVAIVFNVLAHRRWSDANAKGLAPEISTELKRKAHNFARLGIMWTGITFFLGMIFTSFLLSRLP